MQTVNEAPKKRRKSVLLTKEEIRALKDFKKPFNTDIECAEALGIDRAVMLRILLVGSGSPENIEKIRVALGNQKSEA